uniref:long-chain-fatty-acid--CoA ligase n=1 Tax=Setaria digitata TaxID=48799 RepID=A0A915Q1T4_9BILA
MVTCQEAVPFWIRFFILMLRVWLLLYDCLNYLPFELFISPIAKAKPIKGTDSPWHNVDGPVREDFPGEDTIDKLFTHAAKLYGEKAALGTRELLEVLEEKQPDGRVFEKWIMGKYKWESYIEIHNKIGRIASGLKTVIQNDCRAVIFAETRADWLITALSLFRINIPVTTIYATLGEKILNTSYLALLRKIVQLILNLNKMTLINAVIQAINETEATLLVTSAELLTKTVAMGKRTKLRWLVYFRPVHPSKKISNMEMDVIKSQFENVLALDELEMYGSISPEVSPAKRDDIAMIMYTSGSTGDAKGVILTHYNIVSSVAGLGAGIGIICDTDTYIGYLPLAHILEVAAELTCLVRGCRIGYSSPSTLQDRSAKIKLGTHGDCWELKPTLMASVPAIMDRIFKAINDEVAASPRIIQELFRLAYERKRLRYKQGYCSPFLDRIVFKRTRSLLGGKLRGILCGGAALNPETQCFMNICMCCPVVQGYGLTETSAAVSVADVNDLSTGTVGPPLRCTQILLREWHEGGYIPHGDPPRGEILVSGPNLSPGYWKKSEKTAEDFVVINGIRYFATGDIGEFRRDGSLLITDRKKDLIKMQNGEYVSLSKIETALLNCPQIDNVCCYGDSLSAHLIALIVPNKKQLQLNMSTMSWTELCRNPKIIEECRKIMEEHVVRNHLLKSELPKKIYLCDEVWTSESGLLTEAMKLKRHRIKLKYAHVIAQLFHDKH